jgi:hypothetical protein
VATEVDALPPLVLGAIYALIGSVGVSGGILVRRAF